MPRAYYSAHMNSCGLGQKIDASFAVSTQNGFILCSAVIV